MPRLRSLVSQPAPRRTGLWLLAGLAASLALISLPPSASAQPQPAIGASGLPVSDFVPLRLGDTAPPIKVAEWIKGEPLTAFKPGQVTIVEFWATWCPPCKKSIPHLTELQKKHGDKLAVLGVSVWEEIDPIEEGKGTYLQRVKDFVTEWGEKMDYRVAYDGDENSTAGGSGEMARTYMKAAGRPGIPSAFIVDQQGRVAWIGHPLIDMDEPLERIIAGTWDLKSEAEKARLAAENESKVRTLQRQIRAAGTNKNALEAITAAEGLLAIDAQVHYGAAIAAMRISIVAAKDPKTGYAFGGRLVEGPFKDNSEALNAMAWMILDDAEVAAAGERDLALALRAAQRASEVSRQTDAAIEDTLARAHFESGNTAKAIEIQTRAVELASEEMRPDLRKALERYKKALETPK